MTLPVLNNMNEKTLVAGCLFVLAQIFSGCSTYSEPRELTEEQKENNRQRLDQIKTTVSDPIYNVADVACRYKRKFGRWPTVEFLPTSESRFETFIPYIRNNNIYESTLRLKTSPATWILIVDTHSEGDSRDCRVTLLSPGNEGHYNNVKKNAQVIPRLKQYKDRVISGTDEDRNQFAVPFMFAVPFLDPKTYRITSSDKAVLITADIILKVALCTVLGVRPEQCK